MAGLTVKATLVNLVAMLLQARSCWQFQVLLKSTEMRSTCQLLLHHQSGGLYLFFMKNITREKIACSSQVKFWNMFGHFKNLVRLLLAMIF